MMVDFLGFHTTYRLNVLCMDVMSPASGWLNWFRWMLQLWRGENCLKLPYISDIFFDPITSASILTTAVALKMEAVCSFIHSFVCSFIQNARTFSHYAVYKPKDSHHLSTYDRPVRRYCAVCPSHHRQIFNMEVLLSTVFLLYIAYI